MKLFFLALRGVAVCTAMMSMLASCVDRDADYSETTGSTSVNTFDFDTRETVLLNVQYEVPEGYQVLFDVYSENPLEIDADGQVVKRSDITPMLTRMTDGTGKYTGKEEITSYMDTEFYIYTSYIGVPNLYKASLQGGQIMANITWDNMYDMDPVATQTRASYTYTTDLTLLDSSWDWSAKGTPNYLDSDGALSLSTDLLNAIKTTIPEGGNCPAKYRQSADFGVSEPAHVKVRFIGGTSSAKSTFGYYCYKEGATTNEIKNAKKVLVFPNTRTGQGIKGGECVELHYIDENGVDQGTAFPAGVKIGWFIRNNSFNNGTITNGARTYYSTTALNGDGRTHTAAFKVTNFVVLAFEDWTDQDYNDVQFNVFSDPIKAIVTPDLPDVAPPTEPDYSVEAYTVTYKGIVAFEDNWPSKGDYDLNDVVVKYNSVLSYNSKNEVLSTKDTFTAMWSGASYHNSFVYQLNTERSNVVSSLALDMDLEQATIPVFTDMLDETGNNTKKSTVTVTNTFKTPIDHEVFGAAPYNPFICLHRATTAGRKEVHLVNHKPTVKADLSAFHTEADLSDVSAGVYYVSDSKYPFAIHLSDTESYSTPEKEAIDKTYPKFASWVESNGTKDKDWYINN